MGNLNHAGHRLLDGSGRTIEEAKNTIRNCTIKENEAKPVFLAVLEENFPGHQFTITDNGIDNSGAYVDTVNDGDWLKPDWLLTIDGVRELAVEVMVHSECFNRCSFKEVKLRYSVKHKTLTTVIRENYCVIIRPEDAAYLLENEPIQSVTGIYGGKPSIILDTASIMDYASLDHMLLYPYGRWT